MPTTNTTTAKNASPNKTPNKSPNVHQGQTRGQQGAKLQAPTLDEQNSEQNKGQQMTAEQNTDDNIAASGARLLAHRPADVDTGEEPPFWFAPREVWEVRGADITLSPVHMAAAGLIAPSGLG